MDNKMENNIDKYEDSNEELNTLCSTLLCVERIEQILMSMNYTYNEKTKSFEYIFDTEDKHTKTVFIEQKSNKTYYLMIDKRYESKNDKPYKILINYLGQIPDTELDFKVLSNLLDLYPKTEPEKVDEVYFQNIIQKFIKLLLASGYTFNESNNKYFKEVVSFSNMPIYISIYLDTKTDTFQISEEYSQDNLLNKTVSNNLNHESTITLYSGRIPKTKFEFHTVSNLIDLFLN